ncbi:hypothetical protein SYNTR_0675 [Candidatus Syntrophocurvum alkaliphilum]|uniref:Uncharacterized protein n=1 Tax=Candidatus Syntrophocurvum alkaliphilum TaxID=2293317 RepID=A0A6I6DFR2_9FIRM|nr:hypothetical protein [Candidatus Syntrophocurvum alkaliphilum]QGT99268.1 hypothetical protein SYNTR_0675 [Candidatus Syntrophocurvum alkaliphilum]
MTKQNTYEEKIKKLDKAIKAARDDRSRAVASKEHLEKELIELRKKSEELGVNPDELTEKIKELKTEMDSLIEEAKNLLPDEYLEKVGLK